MQLSYKVGWFCNYLQFTGEKMEKQRLSSLLCFPHVAWHGTRIWTLDTDRVSDLLMYYHLVLLLVYL